MVETKGLFFLLFLLVLGLISCFFSVYEYEKKERLTAIMIGLVLLVLSLFPLGVMFGENGAYGKAIPFVDLEKNKAFKVLQFIEETKPDLDGKTITVVKATELVGDKKEIRYIEIPARLSNNFVFYRDKDNKVKVEFNATP